MAPREKKSKSGIGGEAANLLNCQLLLAIADPMTIADKAAVKLFLYELVIRPYGRFEEILPNCSATLPQKSKLVS